MAHPPKGRADYFAQGDYNASCFECGRKFKASELKKHWKGYYVCPEHWEPRHPQDFVRGIADVQAVPWAQPLPADVYVATPLAIAENETVTFAETIAKAMGIVIPDVATYTGNKSNESLGTVILGDGILGGGGRYLGMSSSFSFSEMVTLAGAETFSATDSFSFADGVTIVHGIVIHPAEAITLSEVVSMVKYVDPTLGLGVLGTVTLG